MFYAEVFILRPCASVYVPRLCLSLCVCMCFTCFTFLSSTSSIFHVVAAACWLCFFLSIRFARFELQLDSRQPIRTVCVCTLETGDPTCTHAPATINTCSSSVSFLLLLLLLLIHFILSRFSLSPSFLCLLSSFNLCFKAYFAARFGHLLISVESTSTECDMISFILTI